jgi:L-alanine-DL-glutamate epimerase-like enolase superfamily enzyme
MHVNRRKFLAGATAGAASLQAAALRKAKHSKAPSLAEIDRAAALPVVKRDGLTSPVIIDSIRLLKKDRDYLIHIRSKDGAEGVGVVNESRGDYIAPVLHGNITPFLKGKDARDWDNLLWELYRYKDNYKLYGLLFWSAQASVEFAVLDMLGRIAGKPIGALTGDIVRTEIPIYVASGRRDTTPEQEIEYLRSLVDKSGAKAIKFRLGGRMSRNADAMPGRTTTLIPLVRKSFGDSMVIHADANSSYDPPEAIKIGKLLESVKAIHYEEPCQFDHLEENKIVSDALDIPVALGEQEYSDWRFRWVVANRAVDIVQPDLYYYGGIVRSIRVARMAALAKMATTAHLSGGFGFVYLLHFASCVPDIGPFQEYKLGLDRYGSWFEPAIKAKDGKLSVPAGPGVGIKDMRGLLSGAVELKA